LIAIALSGLVAIVALMVAGWVVSFIKNDVSVVDSLWGPACFLPLVVYTAQLPSVGSRVIAVLVLAGLWALRLAVFVTWRNHGKPEDRRYAEMRERNGAGWRWRSLFTVFLLQATLAWLVSVPLLAVAVGTGRVFWLDYVAAALVIFGLVFETIADLQMAAFQQRPKNADGVMNQGLWRYSRHPNYFGEFCVWWGFFLFAAATGGWWSVLGPALLTFFLLKVSGIGLTEKGITKRRPAYQAYIDRTSAFIPQLPKS
jgi:steroid 5-alpha reductase family enzyme